ncbi:MAG: hypothetical protein CMH83_07530 [Nocardioides sp.]|nr:hypothetical protein [Nocardioides sp.]
MRLPRLRGLVTAAALAVTTLAVPTMTAAPASAETVAVNVAFAKDLDKRGTYGDYLSLTGAVKDAQGNGPLAGRVILQRLWLGSKTWKNVGVDTSPGFAYYPNYDKFNGNAYYRLAYTGGTYSSGSTTYTYPGKFSKPIKVVTGRKMGFKDLSAKRKRPTARVKITPDYRNKRTVLQRKKNGKWRTVQRPKTNNKGQTTFSMDGNRKGILYRLTAKGSKRYATTRIKIRARRY